MEELYNYGLDNNDIRIMIEKNNEIKDLNKDMIKQNIQILKYINCEDDEIKNILMSNPFYLSRCKGDILLLIDTINKLGITNLNLLFDNNPWLLNKDKFEIDNFIKKKLKEGFLISDIIDMINSNSNVLDEY